MDLPVLYLSSTSSLDLAMMVHFPQPLCFLLNLSPYQNSCSGFLNDLWEFDPSHGYWTDLTSLVQGDIPPPRFWFGFTPDLDTKTIYIFGGLGPGRCYSRAEVITLIGCLS